MADTSAPAQTHSISLALRNETNGEMAYPAFTFASEEEAAKFTQWASARGYNPREGRIYTSAEEAIRQTATIASSYWS